MITKKINDNDYILQCPKCKGYGHIDKEQAEGKVSVICGYCDYHETKNWLDNCPDCGRLWGIRNLKGHKGVWFYCTKCRKWKFDKPK